MKKLSKIIVVILSILLIVNVVFTEEDNKNANIVTSVIDGFEKENTWNIHFSMFRSNSWKVGDTSWLPSNKWIKWIKADDTKVDYMRQYILPAGLDRKHLEGGKTILAVKADWDRKGQNWLNLEPSNRRFAEQNIGDRLLTTRLKLKNDINPKAYILLSGKTEKVLCYFWGMGYAYKVKLHIMDHQGSNFIIDGGYLNFYGWKNLEFKIPRFVKQSNRYLPRVRPIKLVRIKIVADPDSKNQGFFTYLDYLHSKTDINGGYFRGRSLEREHIYWDEGSKVTRNKPIEKK